MCLNYHDLLLAEALILEDLHPIFLENGLATRQRHAAGTDFAVNVSFQLIFYRRAPASAQTLGP